MRIRLRLFLTGLLVLTLTPPLSAQSSKKSPEAADKSDILRPAESTSQLLYANETWAVWKTSKLVEETRLNRAQTFVNRFYRQRRSEPLAYLVYAERGTAGNFMASVMADGTVILGTYSNVVSIGPDGVLKRFDSPWRTMFSDKADEHPLFNFEEVYADGVLIKEMTNAAKGLLIDFYFLSFQYFGLDSTK